MERIHQTKSGYGTANMSDTNQRCHQRRHALPLRAGQNWKYSRLFGRDNRESDCALCGVERTSLRPPRSQCARRHRVQGRQRCGKHRQRRAAVPLRSEPDVGVNRTDLRWPTAQPSNATPRSLKHERIRPPPTHSKNPSGTRRIRLPATRRPPDDFVRDWYGRGLGAPG